MTELVVEFGWFTLPEWISQFAATNVLSWAMHVGIHPLEAQTHFAVRHMVAAPEFASQRKFFPAEKTCMANRSRQRHHVLKML